MPFIIETNTNSNLTRTSFAATYQELDNNTYGRNDYQNNRGNFRGNFRGNASRSRDRGSHYKSNVECCNCKRTGHIAKYCRSTCQGHNAFQCRANKVNPASPRSQHYNIECSYSSETNPKTVELCKTIAPINVTESSENTRTKFSKIDRLYWLCITQGTVKGEYNENIPVNILRDNGSLRSLVRASIMSNWEPFDTKEYRVIRGITGDVLKLSLVELEMESPRATGLFSFCTSNELPQSADVLLGNDI